MTDEAHRIATARLSLWPGLTGATLTLVNLSENHSFRVDTPGGRQFVLRLHRQGYQSRRSIESELDWLTAMGRDTDIPVPRPVAGTDGAFVQQVEAGQHAVLFAFEAGREPLPQDDLTALFATLGRHAATAHRHAEGWKSPPGFERQRWDARALDADGLWGDWRQAPNLSPEDRQTLDALDARLRADLAAYGDSADRFGLIHADMRLANLLVDSARIVLLDFDDCGFCWFLYDLAAALSFIETSPQVPDLIRAWLAGYLPVRPLGEADIRMIAAMILYRRMILLAWIGSHGETDLARAHADRFALDTARLARNYLSR